MEKYLSATQLLDFQSPRIHEVVTQRAWRQLPESERILQVYNFVRDEIRFGYNRQDDLTASAILEDGYGQCNTKGILLMALLRAVGIPCRFHGFTIAKALQKGAISGLWYALSPASIVHSWVEVFHAGRWLNTEGFILDLAYLQAIQAKFADCGSNFCGYGVATADLAEPAVYWEGNDTYIQKDGINRDLGTFDAPDGFFGQHGQALGAVKAWLFRHLARHSMNRNIERLRRAGNSLNFPGKRRNL